MIALYPGAFKPPHRGHFEVVKRLLKGNHGGHVYSIDNYQDVGTKALSGKEGKVDKINKVIVFPGGGERNGSNFKSLICCIIPNNTSGSWRSWIT